MRTRLQLDGKPIPKLTRLARAIRIRDAVYPALGNPALFRLESHGPHSRWISESFHIAAVAILDFTSFEVWPYPNTDGLSEHPVGENKVVNLHHSPYGSYELVSFRGGDWERELLRYVGAPLGPLTLRPMPTLLKLLVP